MFSKDFSVTLLIMIIISKRLLSILVRKYKIKCYRKK